MAELRFVFLFFKTARKNKYQYKENKKRLYSFLLVVSKSEFFPYFSRLFIYDTILVMRNYLYENVMFFEKQLFDADWRKYEGT